MSQSERLKKQVLHHHPIHSFYVVPQPEHQMTTQEENGLIKGKAMIATAATFTAAADTTTIVKVIQTAATTSFPSSSSSSAPTINSPTPPPLIHHAGNTSSFDNKAQSNQDNNSNHLPCWLSPLLGSISGVLALALLIYLISRNRKKKTSVAITMMKNDNAVGGRGGGGVAATQYGSRLLNTTTHRSWASLSTINTLALLLEEERLQSPPCTHGTRQQQKRLTADTLVESNDSLLMLKSQYSPQLAFSPSLVAGEFVMDHDAKPPPLPSTLSPSTTLIDHAGILLSSPLSKQEESQQDAGYYYVSNDESLLNNKKKKIEIYEPQINLLQDAFIIPESFSSCYFNEQQQQQQQQQLEEKKQQQHQVVMETKK